MREKLITDITKLALDFWTMNLRNGTFESHLRTFIMNYDKAMNYTHCCKSDSEQLCANCQCKPTQKLGFCNECFDDIYSSA